ncbi:hypothetical protein [Luteococcus sp. OSA5]|uniref:hypothetical protein n=1 Tax=Luteococcus sp. OSA5 TaxID=3401630 RepID=UPI003B4387EC
MSGLSNWHLHAKTHRWTHALVALALLHLAALLLSSRLLPMIGLVGLQLVPLVSVCGVATSPLLAWALQPRLSHEALSSRPLPVAHLGFAVAAVVLPALVVSLATDPTLMYARSVIAATGLTAFALILGAGALSSVPIVAIFVTSVTLARVAPGVAYWGFLVLPGDARTWILPTLLALLPALGSIAATMRARPGKRRGGLPPAGRR